MRIYFDWCYQIQQYVVVDFSSYKTNIFHQQISIYNSTSFKTRSSSYVSIPHLTNHNDGCINFIILFIKHFIQDERWYENRLLVMMVPYIQIMHTWIGFIFATSQRVSLSILTYLISYSFFFNYRVRNMNTSMVKLLFANNSFVIKLLLFLHSCQKRFCFNCVFVKCI